jgi:hypothetical protein
MRRGELTTRVAALENEVARLRKTIEGEQRSATPWWERIAGTFAQDPIYQEARKLGQRQRRLQRAHSSRQRSDDHAGTRHRSPKRS